MKPNKLELCLWSRPVQSSKPSICSSFMMSPRICLPTMLVSITISGPSSGPCHSAQLLSNHSQTAYRDCYRNKALTWYVLTLCLITRLLFSAHNIDRWPDEVHSVPWYKTNLFVVRFLQFLLHHQGLMCFEGPLTVCTALLSDTVIWKVCSQKLRDALGCWV